MFEIPENASESNFAGVFLSNIVLHNDLVVLQKYYEKIESKFDRNVE